MAGERIDVVIDNQGNVSVEAFGIRGRGCQALTEAIERSIGSTLGDQKKPEFVQQAGNPQQARAGQ